ncbi:hypothetical protein OHB12_27325 [Nocardia sp. NBC_01730]|uniref:hypothetical protein n=1 Tax=Nocardia sp. NBC_01730 TaxID=2975998 RepID=UPI002E13B1F1|nr:hypothetical protein OHB12_27325 [Nocardia sp. NBC_01730]
MTTPGTTHAPWNFLERQPEKWQPERSKAESPTTDSRQIYRKRVDRAHMGMIPIIGAGP